MLANGMRPGAKAESHHMRLTILGTGTSMGVPVIGCECAVCTSSDPCNRRLRTSALVQAGETTVLIDAGPDLREQLLSKRVRRLDAVLLTHGHADHVGGIDDLRPLSRGDRSLAIYGNTATLRRVHHQFDYAFDPEPSLSTRPRLELIPIAGPFRIGKLSVLPFEVLHGPQSITGYRFGPLAYITDGKKLPEATWPQLEGLEVLVVNALRYKDHPLHFTVDEALDVVARLRPKRALFVHITHDLDHAATNAALPPHVQLACDGQTVEIPEL